MSGAASKAAGRAFAELDWDRDGDVDLVLINANSPRVQLFENQLESNLSGASLWVDLRGAAKTDGPDEVSNRDAVGARVELRRKSGLQVAEKRAGEGFAAQNTAWLHFGLGADSSIDGLTVFWPSGRKSEIDGPLQAGQRIRIYEDPSDSPTLSSLVPIP